VKLACRNLSKTYGSGAGAVAALEDVSLELADREILCLVGPSGCGKTTLLKILAGLLVPDSGSVTLDVEGRDGRPDSALVFQEHGLFPWMKVVDNVAFGLRMSGQKRRESADRAREFLRKVGLASFADSYPHQLSVGMRQRVNLARAFVVEPRMLLMDEPFASLDAQTRVVLQGELLKQWERAPKSMIYVTHDLEEAVLMGDRVVVMSGRPGRIRDEITVPLARPRDPALRDGEKVKEIKRRIWAQLEDEVMRSLRRSS
jgi:NitT/TauT family transport system ATP-binding protein